MRTTRVSAASLFLWVALLPGCQQREATDRLTEADSGQRSPALSSRPQTGQQKLADPAVSVPFDLGRVMRQVRHAFRASGAAHVGGRGTCRVRVEPDGRVTLSPTHHDGEKLVRGAPLGLSTTVVTRGERELDVAVRSRRVLADGRLALARGEVVELLRNVAGGVQQSWRLARQPAGRGDLEVRVAVSGQRYLGTTGGGLHFVDPATGVGLRYGRATWIDARGKRSDIQGRFEHGTILLRVPARLVRASAYPAVLDPVVGAEFGMDQPAHGPPAASQQQPAVAFDGTNYLVVWQDQREVKTWDILGTRVSGTGSVLEPEAIAISTATNSQTEPAVAYGGGHYLVAWRDARTGKGDIFGARVKATDGTVQEPAGIAISTATNDQQSPAVAFDGTSFMVVWEDKRSGNWDIYGARVSVTGTVLDVSGLTLSAAANDQQSPAVAFDGTNYLVAWQDKRSLADWDIYAARVTPAGGLLDSGGVAVALVTNNQQEPAVAFDGTNYFVVWQDDRDPTTKWDIYGARVDSQVTVLDPFGVPISKYDGDIHDQQEPAVAFDGTHHLVLWQDNRNNDKSNANKWDIYGARVSTAGAVVDTGGTPFVVVSGLGGSQQHPALAFGSTGCLAAWSDYRTEVSGLVSSSGWDIYGTTVSTAGTVGSASGIPIATDLNDQQQPAVAFDGTSNYLVVWADYRTGAGGPGWDIHGALVDNTGTPKIPAGITISAATDDQIEPAVVFGGGQYLVVWQDRRDGQTWDIYGARVSTTGTVTDAGGIPVSQAVSNQQSPAVAHGGPYFMVVWQDYRIGKQWDIYAARIDSSGTVQDPVGIAVSIATSHQQEPDVAFDGTNFFAVWEDRRGGTNFDIYGARVSQGAILPDPQGVVVSIATSDQQAPAVLHDGTQYVVAWQDKRAGTEWDIYVTRVNDQAVTQDANGIAVSTAAGDQLVPALGHDGYNTVVAWQDLRSGSSSDIYAARLTSQGVVGDTLGFAVSSDAVEESAPALAGNTDGRVLLTYYSRYAGTIYGTDRIRGRIVVTAAPDGEPCAADIDCKSSHCVDGVCCNTACGGGVTTDCQACSTSAGGAADGVCGPAAQGTECRPTAGGCDIAESCDGTATICPADGVKPASTVCRPSAGDCDIVESCDGVAAACPVDAVEPSTKVCRPAAGECDLAESCDGIGADCPSDQTKPNGTVCSSGLCYLGVCTVPPDGGFPDTATIGDAQVGDAQLTDAQTGDAKVTDAKVTDAKVTDAEVTDAKVTDAKATDAGTDATADARPDALCFGPSCPGNSDGCSCAVAGRRSGAGWPLLTLLLGLAALLRARRSACRTRR